MSDAWDDYWTNIYSSPEKFGLTIIGSLYDPQADYSFNDLIVWQHNETGRVYWATDSGCSCPSPFEDYKSIDQLTEVTNATWNDFQDAVNSHCVPTEWVNDDGEYVEVYKDDPQAVAKVDVLRKVAYALAAKR